VFWHGPASGTMLTPHRLAADISEYLTPVDRAPAVAAVVLAMALLLWELSLRAVRRPWSWWLAAALVAYPMVLAQLAPLEGLWAAPDSGLALQALAAVGAPRLLLPGALLIGLSLIAADPRPALGAALYGACSLLTALSIHVAYGALFQDIWRTELVVAAVISMAGVAAATQAARHRHRLARL
jgi:hypothetical protein